MILVCLSGRLAYKGDDICMVLENLFYQHRIADSTVSAVFLHTVKKESPAFCSILEQTPKSRADALWPTSRCRSACPATSALQDAQPKSRKLFYFSREYIRVSNTVSQKRLTSENPYTAIFADVFLNTSFPSGLP